MIAKSLFMATILYVFLCSPVAFAKGSANPDSKKPIEITADETLEWHRGENFFRARKNVRAVQGDMVLICDLMTVKYRDGEGGGMDIHTINADGAVQVHSSQSKVYGDNAIYNIDKGYAVMTGKNLRLVSTDQIVTARDKFQYWVTDGRLEAIGDAVAVREGDKLEADKIIALFKDDASGKRILKSLEAIGNVKITTPSEILTGKRAIYKVETDIAEIIDNVKIIRGQNILEGSRAEINLKTDLSKMFGGNVTGADNGRVRGVFYPGSEEKTE